MKNLIAWFVVAACLVPTLRAEARYYDPKTGRYLQEDSVGSSVSTPEQHNPYPYAQNRPTVFIDPYGRLIFGRKEAEEAFLDNFEAVDPQGVFTQEERALMARKFVDEINELEATELKGALKSGDSQKAGDIAGNVYERIKKKAVRRGTAEDQALLQKIEQAQAQGVCILPGAAADAAPKQ